MALRRDHGITVEIRLPYARGWHARLRERLRAGGHDADVVIGTTAAATPAGLALLVLFEKTLFGSARAASGAGEATALRGVTPVAPDLVLDLSGDASSDAPCIGVAWDGVEDENALVAALLEKRSPRIEILLRDSARSRPRVVARGLAALPEPDVFTASFDRVCARTGDLCAQAIERWARGEALVELPASEPTPARAASPLRFGAANLAGKIARRLQALSGGAPRWQIGWRTGGEAATIDTLRWPQTAWSILPDDGKRYFADPFPWRRDGALHVFCEEYPYATGRGILSYFTIDEAGRASAPRPFLETSCHLSYPQIFSDGDAIYMLPETSGAGVIELWRAERFPDRWLREATLVEGVAASDATLVKRNGRYWIFATVATAGESTWDTLALFSADALLGPWRAHRDNPVVIDASAARPAGATVERGGRLLRPVQDCRAGYGAALSIFEVETLDETGFSQKPLARLGPPAGLGASGVHTLNAAEGIEVIDFFAP